MTSLEKQTQRTTAKRTRRTAKRRTKRRTALKEDAADDGEEDADDGEEDEDDGEEDEDDGEEDDAEADAVEDAEDDDEEDEEDAEEDAADGEADDAEDDDDGAEDDDDDAEADAEDGAEANAEDEQRDGGEQVLAVRAQSAGREEDVSCSRWPGRSWPEAAAMLEQVVVFTRGGVVLWKYQFGKVDGSPVDDFIRNVLIEVRCGAGWRGRRRLDGAHPRAVAVAGVAVAAGAVGPAALPARQLCRQVDPGQCPRPRLRRACARGQHRTPRPCRG